MIPRAKSISLSTQLTLLTALNALLAALASSLLLRHVGLDEQVRVVPRVTGVRGNGAETRRRVRKGVSGECKE
jgi:hypothetical protein